MNFENAEQARGFRYQPDVPKEGWECVRVDNLGGRSEICQWCDLRRIQHAFVMHHISWPVEIRAGSKCAADIGNPYVAQTVYEPDDEQLDDPSGPKPTCIHSKPSPSSQSSTIPWARGHVAGASANT